MNFFRHAGLNYCSSLETWPHSTSGPILAASIHFLLRGRLAFPDREILFKKRKS